MDVPDYYEKFTNNNMRKKVLKLKKALYGLRCSPKRWYICFADAMKELDFTQCDLEPCIFVWKNDDKFVLLLLYVDDILITGNNERQVKILTDLLKQKFRMTELGEVRKFLGLQIERDIVNKTLTIHQTKYIENILKWFEMSDCHAVRTPIITNAAEKQQIKSKERLVNSNNRKSRKAKKILENSRGVETKNFPYCEAIGSLMYLANGSRPDLTYTVNMLSRKQSNPTWEDWMKVKRVFHYLRGTITRGIVMRGQSEGVQIFTDASLGTEKGHSMTGILLKLFGDVVFWRSNKQRYVALSSAEAEYVAMSEGCKEVVATVGLLENLFKFNFKPAILYEDNTSAMALAKSEGSPKLRHLVDIRLHYVREAIQQNYVKLEWISSKLQEADIFTKALTPESFEALRNKILNDV